MTRFIPRPLIAALCVGLSFAAMPGLARASNPMTPITEAKESNEGQTANETSAYSVSVPSPKVGDTVFYLAERNTVKVGQWADGKPVRPSRGQIEIRVMSVDEEEGTTLHRVRRGPAPAAASGSPAEGVDAPLPLDAIEFQLVVSDVGEVVRVVDFDELYKQYRAIIEAEAEKAAKSMTSKEREVHRTVMSNLLRPEVMQAHLLDFIDLIYAVGSGLEFEDKTVTEPLERPAPFGGGTFKGFQETRVVTSRADRTATIHSIGEVSSELASEGHLRAMRELFKGTDVDRMDSTELRAQLAKAKGSKITLRDEQRIRIEDGQAWPRSVAYRQVIGGDGQGAGSGSITDTRVRRIDPADAAVKP